MEIVKIEKIVFGKTTYENVIDTKFSQLIKTSSTESVNLDTVDNFFRLYNLLFYDIPKKGPTDSHEFLITESTNYVGITQNSEDIQALLDEIATLRQESLEKDKTLISLTTQLAQSKQ